MTSLPEADASGGEIFFKWFNIKFHFYDIFVIVTVIT